MTDTRGGAGVAGADQEGTPPWPDADGRTLGIAAAEAWALSGRPAPLIESDEWDGFGLALAAVLGAKHGLVVIPRATVESADEAWSEGDRDGYNDGQKAGRELCEDNVRAIIVRSRFLVPASVHKGFVVPVEAFDLEPLP